jgi:taurine--2-oxoglutarate transaminase
MEPDQARATVRRTNFAAWKRQRGWDPLLIVRAEGSRFWDSSGREYLDFASQLVATNLGYGNRAVIEAIQRQAGRVPYVAPGFASEPRAELSELLGGVLPPGLRSYLFSTSGTDANEAALKIARSFRGRSKVLARPRSYHGSTVGALAVSGDPRRRLVGESTLPGGTVFVPDCYCYRCPLGLEYPSCKVACAEEVERTLNAEEDVAAMILEPVVGTNGVIVPVPEYLPRVRAITERHDVLLIADEVMTGWGRTGRWFAVDHWGVVPDILTTAKGITGAYAPLALTATTTELHDAFLDRPLPHGQTYEAHPLSLAPAVAAIEEYRRLDLVARSAREGEYLRRRLGELAGRHVCVGDVRGLGLFAAVELVRDARHKTPFNTDEDLVAGRPMVVDDVVAALRREGVHAMGWISHLLVAPPLVISREELDRGIDAFDRALSVADAQAVASPRSSG